MQRDFGCHPPQFRRESFRWRTVAQFIPMEIAPFVCGRHAEKAVKLIGAQFWSYPIKIRRCKQYLYGFFPTANLVIVSI